MTGKDVRRIYEATPFEPFRVQMANGKSVDVPHPEFIRVSQGGHRLIVEHSDETFELIDISLVTSLETLPKNGSKRARSRKPKR
jgi:hypothetical protein